MRSTHAQAHLHPMQYHIRVSSSRSLMFTQARMLTTTSRSSQSFAYTLVARPPNLTNLAPFVPHQNCCHGCYECATWSVFCPSSVQDFGPPNILGKCTKNNGAASSRRHPQSCDLQRVSRYSTYLNGRRALTSMIAVRQGRGSPCL